MPSGAYPARISVQKSCPDRSEVNGCRLLLRQSETPPPPAPGSALTAVPTAMNSAMSLPNSFISTSSRTPTMPSAPSASASASIRVMASSRAWYMAWESTSSSWFLPQRPTCSPDVVDRAAQHQAERAEPGLADEQELVHRQVRGEDARPGGPGGARPGGAGRPAGHPRPSAQRSASSVSPVPCWSVIASPHTAHTASPADTARRGPSRTRAAWRRCGSSDMIASGGGGLATAAKRTMAVPTIVASTMWSFRVPDRALALVDAHVHPPDHDAFPAEPAHVLLQLLARVVPGVVHQLGVADHLGVARAPAGLAHGQPVVVPGPHRDAQGQPGGHPARRASAWRSPARTGRS